jgi:hypothetical protein
MLHQQWQKLVPGRPLPHSPFCVGVAAIQGTSGLVLKDSTLQRTPVLKHSLVKYLADVSSAVAASSHNPAMVQIRVLQA